MNDIFIGRNSELELINSYLQELTSPNIPSIRFLVIQGPGGIGKTRFLSKCRQMAREKGIITTNLIDLKATSNRSELSFFQGIVDTLSSQLNNTSFLSFYEALDAYNVAQTEEKWDLKSLAEIKFQDACKEISLENPILLLLDTWESIQGTQIEDWIWKTLKNLGNKVGVMMAGREVVTKPNSMMELIYLGPLKISETQELAAALYNKRGESYDLSQQTLEVIHGRARGKPIILALVIDLILDNPEIIKSISQISLEQFEEEIIKRFREELEVRESKAIMYMATADRRFDIQILNILTGWNDCISIANKLARFSFVKVRVEQDESILTLHDEMLFLINHYASHPQSTQDEIRKEVLERYYNVRILHENNPQVLQALVVEKLHYLLKIDPKKTENRENVIAFFEAEMSKALEEYKFDLCSLLLNEVNDASVSQEHMDIYQLFQAEMFIKQYLPFAAKPIFDRLLNRFDRERKTKYFSRVLAGLAKCKLEGSPLEESKATEAIEDLQKNLELCREKNLQKDMVTIHYQLGTTYSVVGNHRQALFHYEEALQAVEKTNDDKLKTKILDATGDFYRELNDMVRAQEYIYRSLAIKKELNDSISLGNSYKLLGNCYRDQRDFENARVNYTLAIKEYGQIGDVHDLAWVYNEFGWLGYMLGQKTRDFSLAMEYTDKSQLLAQKHHFGRLMSDNYHSYYHIKYDQGRHLEAEIDLKKGLELSRKYSNNFMLIDCLFHTAEYACQRQDIQSIYAIIDELDELERQGGAFRVFRGRTLNVLGDIYYDRLEYDKALDCWEDGYYTMMLYGKTATSMVKSLNTQFEERREKLVEALRLANPARVSKMKKHWEDLAKSEGYTFMMQIFSD